MIAEAVHSVPAHKVPEEVVRRLSEDPPATLQTTKIDPLMREYARRHVEIIQKYDNRRSGPGNRALRELRKWYEAEKEKRDPSPKIDVEWEPDAPEPDPEP